MPKFNVGDWVQPIGLDGYFKGLGRIVRVIHPELSIGLDEYEVRFGLNTAFLHEMQLRPVPSANDDRE